MKEVDAFVFLTRRQLLDAQARFVLGEKCHHIPHVADNLIREKLLSARNINVFHSVALILLKDCPS
ncbi:hypothetical protein O0544_22145 [Edwardsiella anguillarum]|nr:hypothetical protein [Edwardsiella anguillarum]